MFRYILFFLVCLTAIVVAAGQLSAERTSHGGYETSPRSRFSFATDPLRHAPRGEVAVRGRMFEFAFVDHRGGEGWRIYVLRQPGYGGWAAGAHESHRYYDSDLARHYVCIDPSKQPLRRIQDAVALADLWAKGTVRYIDTGRGF